MTKVTVARGAFLLDISFCHHTPRPFQTGAKVQVVHPTADEKLDADSDGDLRLRGHPQYGMPADDGSVNLLGLVLEAPRCVAEHAQG